MSNAQADIAGSAFPAGKLREQLDVQADRLCALAHELRGFETVDATARRYLEHRLFAAASRIRDCVHRPHAEPRRFYDANGTLVLEPFVLVAQPAAGEALQ